MKKLFILAVSMSLAMGVASAQTTTDKNTKTTKTTAAGPVMTFAESKFDFGNIKQGDIVEHVFKFKNTGNAPLVIKQVDVTCGCTTPEWPKEPIAPGKSGVIKAVFNSAGKMGQQNKVITFQSNATNAPTQVTIVSNVQEKAPAVGLVKPAEGPVEGVTTITKEVKLKDSKTKSKAKN